MKIYLDANFFIQFIEAENEVLKDFYRISVERDDEFLTSELTLLETLTGAIRDDDALEIAAYEDWLNEGNLTLRVVPVDRSVLRKAAEIRVSTRNKTPDAIHVATALLQDCDVLVSSDRKLKVPEGVRKIRLEDLGNLI